MAADPARRPPEPIRLGSLRLPADPWPHALATHAHQVWRLARRGGGAATGAATGASTAAPTAPAAPLESGNAADEFRSVGEFMRLYATLRFYQLALLLGTTGSLVTALTSEALRSQVMRPGFLKAGGLVVSLAFLVMEWRASSYWHGLRRRANELAEALRYEPFPVSRRWSPLTTSGAGFYLHALVALLWLASLFGAGPAGR